MKRIVIAASSSKPQRPANIIHQLQVRLEHLCLEEQVWAPIYLPLPHTRALPPDSFSRRRNWTSVVSTKRTQLILETQFEVPHTALCFQQIPSKDVFEDKTHTPIFRKSNRISQTEQMCTALHPHAYPTHTASLILSQCFSPYLLSLGLRYSVNTYLQP